MENIVQGSVMAFREGLEAFLILVLIIKFIDRTGNKNLKTKCKKVAPAHQVSRNKLNQKNQLKKQLSKNNYIITLHYLR